MLLSVRHEVRVSQSAVYCRAGQAAGLILLYGRADATGDALVSVVLAHFGRAMPIPASVAMANAGLSPLPEELRDLPNFATVPLKLIH